MQDIELGLAQGTSDEADRCKGQGAGVEFCGVRMRNCVMVAPGTPTKNEEFLVRAQEAGAGAVVFKTAVSESLALTRRWARPRFKLLDWEKRVKTPASYTLYSIEQAYPGTEREYADELSRARRRLEIPVFGSILAVAPVEWTRMARMLEDAGADALELDLSCPHIPLDGADLEPLREAISAAVESVKIPVVAKMKPVDNLVAVAQASVAAGARGTSLCNRMSGLDIDIDTRRPVMHGSFAGFGGPWAKYYMFKHLADLAGRIDVPVSATSGVSSWQDVVKYLLLGATTVQVCTSVILDGFDKLREIVDGLDTYFAENGLTPAEVRGGALPNILGSDEIEREPPVHAVLSPGECRNCRRCLKVCFFHALAAGEGHVRLDESACDGCGLCAEVCPYGALRMIRDEGGVGKR